MMNAQNDRPKLIKMHVKLNSRKNA